MQLRGSVKSRGVQLLALLVLLLIARLCNAETRCPWLNVATAAGVLDGPTTLEMHATEDGGNMCVFQSKNGAGAHSLQISVRPMKDEAKGIIPYQSRCTSQAAALKAVGNEAILCATDDGASRGEQVVSRVRGDVFIVCLSASEGKRESTTRDMLVDRTKLIAEQVAGNLF